MEETQHLCRWHQQQVAKIVHCGEHYPLIIEEATRRGGLRFLSGGVGVPHELSFRKPLAETLTFTREVAQLSSLSGDAYLAEQIYGTIRQFSSRTPRQDALVVLRELLRKLEQYKPTPETDDVDRLKERIAVLEEQLSEPSTEETTTDTSESSSVFIIMPFSPEFNDVWKGGIQRAAQSEGVKPIRVDMIIALPISPMI